MAQACQSDGGVKLRAADLEIEAGAEDASVAGDDASQIVPMGPEEKVTLLLRQEVAMQLERPLADIRTDVSYFDLGLSSLAITTLIQNANTLLGEDLSPGVLFEYSDIESLAAYLAATYPSKVGALTVRRGKEPAVGLGELRCIQEFETAISSAVATDDDDLAEILWQEASLADDYEKVTF